MGVLVGLCTGVALSLWMAFGQPKPPPPKLPVSVAGCDKELFTNITLTTTAIKTDDSSYFWLYKVSYLYLGVFGLLCTLLVGYTSSLFFTRSESEERAINNPDLFIPPLSKRLAKKKNNNSTHIFNTGNGNTCDTHVF